jgi:hypothetical protein
MAPAAGRRVMAARPLETEAGIAFAGLIDLCDRVGSEVLADQPWPERTAREVALLRAEPLGAAAPDPDAIAVAYLSVLRRMTAACGDDRRPAVARSLVGIGGWPSPRAGSVMPRSSSSSPDGRGRRHRSIR